MMTIAMMIIMGVLNNESESQEVEISCCNEDGCNGRPKPRWFYHFDNPEYDDDDSDHYDDNDDSDNATRTPK